MSNEERINIAKDAVRTALSDYFYDIHMANIVMATAQVVGSTAEYEVKRRNY